MSQHEINLPSLQASYMWTDDDDPQEQSYIKDKNTLPFKIMNTSSYDKSQGPRNKRFLSHGMDPRFHQSLGHQSSKISPSEIDVDRQTSSSVPKESTIANFTSKVNKRKERYDRTIACAYMLICCLCIALMVVLLALLFGLPKKNTQTTGNAFISSAGTSTSTTSTSTTTTTTTTTTTPVPPCQPTNVGSSSTLLSISSVSSTGYICYAYEWIASTTGMVTLAFQLRNDPDYWYLDDVSVYSGGIQMLVNGGFETGSLSPWVITLLNGNCLLGSIPGQVCNTSPHTGTYGYCDGCNSIADEVSQSFMATAGQVYIISFWLEAGSIGSVITALVTIS